MQITLEIKCPTCRSDSIKKHHPNLIYKEFCKLGYNGEEFICLGHYYPNYGAVYWIHDSQMISLDESRKLIDQLIENKLLG